MILGKKWTLLISKHRLDGLTDGRHEIMFNLKQYQVRKNQSCTPEMTAPLETHLPTILSSYKLDIFNPDEFDLFFQALPNKPPELKGENAVVVNTAKPHSLGCVQRTSHWKEKKF